MNFLPNRYLEIKERCMAVAEAPASMYVTEKMVSLPERLVKCFWYDQLLDRARMKTADGRRVKVLAPGEWNLGPGPDFLSACVELEGGGAPRRGDVEIHVRSGGWKAHGHDRNPEYDGVILHVAMWNDTGGDFITDSKGGAIPQLILASCLEEDIVTLSAKVDMENYPYNSESRLGRCKEAADAAPDRARQLLEMAAKERFFLKARRFARELSREKFENVLYRGLLEGLGYRKNKKPFRRLAECVSLKAARKARDAAPRMDRAAALEALYFGASGLLADLEVDMWDEETREYCETAAHFWKEYRNLARPGALRKSDWTLRGVRPANFPSRRVAGLAALMARDGDGELVKTVRLFGGRLKESAGVKDMKQSLDALAEALGADAEGYWARHMTPGGKLLDSTPALIGKPLAMTLALNIVMPLLLGYAQEDNDVELRDRILALFSVFPRLNANEISKIMNHRLRGDAAGDPAFMKREAAQQGLIHVFFDFCDENIKDCAACAFPKMLKMEE